MADRVHLPMLSKTRYLYGVQCDKRLYLDCHETALAPEISAGQQRLFDQGHEVGALATQRYPGGVRIEYSRARFAEAAEATARAMADRSVPAIFEPAFEHAGVRVRVDILVRQPRGWWRVEEVKSSTGVHDDVHLPDLGVQLYVLAHCGVRVREAGILHLDRNYVRTTELDVEALFAFAERRDDARALHDDVRRNLRRWKRQLVQPTAPEVTPGRRCVAPYECPFTAHCIAPPGRFSLQRLPRASTLIEALGPAAVDDVRRLPDDVALTEAQARAVRALRTGREYVGPGLGEALAQITYPLHFLDFETFMPAVPRYRRTRPYQALPFQWSDHVVRAAGGRPTHHEYLHTDDSDPRRAFVDSLLAALGSRGTIVVYTSYERTQLEALATAFPAYRSRIRAVQTRLFDLHAVVKQHYYHRDLDGSFSLKALIPVLAPSLTYGAIADGNAAGAAYAALIESTTPAKRRAEIVRALRRYCGTDTLAMVKVWTALAARARRAS